MNRLADSKPAPGTSAPSLAATGYGIVLHAMAASHGIRLHMQAALRELKTKVLVEGTSLSQSSKRLSS